MPWLGSDEPSPSVGESPLVTVWMKVPVQVGVEGSTNPPRPPVVDSVNEIVGAKAAS